jgi:hypothetical protein
MTNEKTKRCLGNKRLFWRRVNWRDYLIYRIWRIQNSIVFIVNSNVTPVIRFLDIQYVFICNYFYFFKMSHNSYAWYARAGTTRTCRNAHCVYSCKPLESVWWSCNKDAKPILVSCRCWCFETWCFANIPSLNPALMAVVQGKWRFKSILGRIYIWMA